MLYLGVRLIIFITNVDLVNINLQIVYYSRDESFNERIVVRSLNNVILLILI